MSRGQIDMISLVIGSMLIILFIVLGAVFISGQSVRTDLGSSIQFSESIYKSQVAAASILDDDVRDRLTNFTYSGDPEAMKKFEKRLESDISGKYEEYSFNLKGENLEFSSSDSRLHGMEVVIASPDTEKRTVAVKTGGVKN